MLGWKSFVVGDCLKSSSHGHYHMLCFLPCEALRGLHCSCLELLLVYGSFCLQFCLHLMKKHELILSLPYSTFCHSGITLSWIQLSKIGVHGVKGWPTKKFAIIPFNLVSWSSKPFGVVDLANPFLLFRNVPDYWFGLESTEASPFNLSWDNKGTGFNGPWHFFWFICPIILNLWTLRTTNGWWLWFLNS